MPLTQSCSAFQDGSQNSERDREDKIKTLKVTSEKYKEGPGLATNEEDKSEREKKKKKSIQYRFSSFFFLLLFVVLFGSQRVSDF